MSYRRSPKVQRWVPGVYGFKWTGTIGIRRFRCWSYWSATSNSSKTSWRLSIWLLLRLAERSEFRRCWYGILLPATVPQVSCGPTASECVLRRSLWTRCPVLSGRDTFLSFGDFKVICEVLNLFSLFTVCLFYFTNSIYVLTWLRSSQQQELCCPTNCPMGSAYKNGRCYPHVGIDANCQIKEQCYREFSDCVNGISLRFSIFLKYVSTQRIIQENVSVSVARNGLVIR